MVPAMSEQAGREYDIILWGATGFTGALVAEYLVKRGLGDVRLALAGRSRAKLESVRAELTKLDPSAAELPLVLGDSYDRASLDALAASTKVVCTTVGPYAKYGEALVAACAEAGTHYCDLTGEAQFIHRMIEGYHERAEASGARIVNCCGFDSIPSDLGTYMLHQAFSERGGQLARVRMYAGETKGGASGGTVASGLNLIDEAKSDRSVLKIAVDPYSLYPKGTPRGGDTRPQQGPGRDADLGMWTAPFFMAAINSKIVRRSNALLDFAYGPDFRYAEASTTGSGASGLLRSLAMSAGTAALLPALAIGPTRRMLEARLPKPGEGPDRAARESGFFVMRCVGDGVDASGNPLQLRGTIKGVNDPGYGETAKMLAESALCLAFDDLDCPGGLRTPASTMAEPLLARLRAAGMTFEVR